MSVGRSQKNKNTRPERRLLAACRRLGLSEPERNVASLPGTPDLVWREERVAVFVHGCWWHGCEQHWRPPRKKRAYWIQKVKRNRIRDSRAIRLLSRHGWKTIVAWEHDNHVESARRIMMSIKSKFAQYNFDWEAAAASGILRIGQVGCIKTELRRFVTDGARSCACVMCVGSGKTIAGALSPFVLAQHMPMRRVLIVTPGLEIKENWDDTFNSKKEKSVQQMFSMTGPDLEVAVINAESDSKARLSLAAATRESVDVVVANIQSLVGRLDSFPRDFFDLVVFDETHHGAAPTYVKVSKWFTGRWLHFTGTPDRSDGKYLPNFPKDAHGNMIADFTYGLREGWRDGIIKRLSVQQVKYDQATIRFEEDGEVVLTADELRELLREDGTTARNVIPSDEFSAPVILRVKESLQSYRAGGVQRTSVLFCMSIMHAKRVQRLCEAIGLRAAIVHNKLADDANKDTIKRFRAGAFDVIVNVNMLREGWDDPMVCVIGLLTIYRNRLPLEQAVGRSLRVNDKSGLSATVVYSNALGLDDLVMSLRDECELAVKEDDDEDPPGPPGPPVPPGPPGPPPWDQPKIDYVGHENESWSVATIDQRVSLDITDDPILHDMATKFLAERSIDAPVTDLVKLLHEARGSSGKHASVAEAPPEVVKPKIAATNRVDLTMDAMNENINKGLTWLTGRCMRLLGSDASVAALREALGDASLSSSSGPGAMKTAINGWLKWKMKKGRPLYKTPKDFENAYEFLRQLAGVVVKS